jgi:hypothetical protein
MIEMQNTAEKVEETARAAWQRPAFEVISLACEISAYAPDDGGPLF